MEVRSLFASAAMAALVATHPWPALAQTGETELAGSGTDAANPRAAPGSAEANNPLLHERWDTPFEVPDFPAIEFEHFRPAFEAALARLRTDLDAITANPEPPSFENTLDALELAGARFNRVSHLFFTLQRAADAPDNAMERLRLDLEAELSLLTPEIWGDTALFARVRAVYLRRESLELSTEQLRVLTRTYDSFVHAGVLLDEAQRARLTELDAQLSRMTRDFGRNHFANTTDFVLLIEDEALLAGLPAPIVTAAAARADATGGWAFGLDRSTFDSVMVYAESRELRRRLWRAHVSRGYGEVPGAEDALAANAELALRIARLRAERAALFGYENHAEFVLRGSMAGGPARAAEMMEQLLEGAVARAAEETAALQALAERENDEVEIRPWDRRRYAERLAQDATGFDLETARAYFELNAMRDACFALAERLFGVTFTLRSDIPVYHPDVEAYAVSDATGGHLGVFLFDPIARPSKADGAWTGRFRSASALSAPLRPVVGNVFAFTAPDAGRPTLLSLDETETLFHEFGHALQILLSRTRYDHGTGGSLAADFEDLPAQLFAAWAFEPAFLSRYARRHDTDAAMPDALIQRIHAERRHVSAAEQAALAAAALLDLAWHALSPEAAAAITDARAFEAAVFERLGLPPDIEPRYRSGSFVHVFGGGFSARYYAYLWTQVLAADAHAAFTETGDPFNPDRAQRLGETVFAQGGAADPMTLYTAFRGREPRVDALVARMTQGLP